MTEKYELRYWIAAIGLLFFLLADGSLIAQIIGIIILAVGAWQIYQCIVSNKQS